MEILEYQKNIKIGFSAFQLKLLSIIPPISATLHPSLFLSLPQVTNNLSANDVNDIANAWTGLNG